MAMSEENRKQLAKSIVKVLLFLQASREVGFSDQEIKDMVRYTMDKRKEQKGDGKDI